MHSFLAANHSVVVVVVVVIAVLLSSGNSVVGGMKENDFKRCDQSGFCTRNRAYADRASNSGKQSPFYIDKSSLSWDKANGHLSASMFERHGVVSDPLVLNIDFYVDAIVRVRVEESSHRRYKVKDVLIDDLSNLKKSVIDYHESPSGTFTISLGSKSSAILRLSPFALDVVDGGGVPILSVNNKGWFNFEQYRPRDSPNSPSDGGGGDDDGDDGGEESSLQSRLVQGMWEESFGGHTDSKKFGPSSIAVDVTFVGAADVFGIPEHASSLALKSTRGGGDGDGTSAYSEPYRLYNLDVFEFELDRSSALYGSVPFMTSHKYDPDTGRGHSAGVFWLNAAETWIDVARETTHARLVKQNSASHKVNPVSTTTHWISESGVMELFLFTGSEPKEIARYYAMLTGAQNLPPIFSLGYHQCRWNYMSQEEVMDVVGGLERNDLSADVIWLDIEHTDEKKYFTWHPDRFNSSMDMITDVARSGRRMVTIVDPHIKRDKSYSVSQIGTENHLFVRNKDGADFDGWCWPGSSSWFDFTNLRARQEWAKLFDYDEYEGTDEHIFTWNDMNEPSVFSGPEVTMPKDNLHHEDWEHRDVHNIYGMYLHRATYSGHVYRSLSSFDSTSTGWQNSKHSMDGAHPHRPFVLSRAFFAGTQRYGAIWTGDNMAKWEHLASSAPMLLSVSVGGIGFCGVDVGGFFFNPSKELLTRWYQAGIHYPFFRAHAHIEAARREPWIAGEPYLGIIKAAIRTRYTLLPYWYTQFRHGQLRGVTPMRPLFYEFPNEVSLLKIDDQYMVGSALMVKPNVRSLDDGGSNVDVLLPGREPWYDYYTLLGYYGVPGVTFSDLKIESPAPLLIRGGSVIPTRTRARRSTMTMKRDPFTLIVALDSKDEAQGDWYYDDGEGFTYCTKGEFAHQILTVQVTHDSISIQSRNWKYDDYDADVRETNRKMKPWQRPFISDPVLEYEGSEISWNSAYKSMTLSSTLKYRKPLNDHVRIERISILGLRSHNLGTWKNGDIKNVEAFTITGDKKKSAEITVENFHFEELSPAEGQAISLPVTKLTIKKPNVGIALDFDITISK